MHKLSEHQKVDSATSVSVKMQIKHKIVYASIWLTRTRVNPLKSNYEATDHNTNKDVNAHVQVTNNKQTAMFQGQMH